MLQVQVGIVSEGPNLPLLRPRISCLQAVSEVSTAVQELTENKT